jgi:hypothetical protein
MIAEEAGSGASISIQWSWEKCIRCVRKVRIISLNDRLFIEAGERSLAYKSEQSCEKAKVYRLEIQADSPR